MRPPLVVGDGLSGGGIDKGPRYGGLGSNLGVVVDADIQERPATARAYVRLDVIGEKLGGRGKCVVMVQIDRQIFQHVRRVYGVGQTVRDTGLLGVYSVRAIVPYLHCILAQAGDHPQREQESRYDVVGNFC